MIQGEGLRLQSIKVHFTNQPLYLPPAQSESCRTQSGSGVKKPECTFGEVMLEIFWPVENLVISEYTGFVRVAGRVCPAVRKVDFVWP